MILAGMESLFSFGLRDHITFRWSLLFLSFHALSISVVIISTSPPTMNAQEVSLIDVRKEVNFCKKVLYGRPFVSFVALSSES